METPYIIGITGGSASGKTKLLNTLKQQFSDGEVCFISQDDYYKKKEFQPLDTNGIANFDLPESVDSVTFVADLLKLKAGKEIFKDSYTFNQVGVDPLSLCFKPAPVLIVEGLFVLHYPQLVELLDLKLFIETKEDLRLQRRLQRDKVERGYDANDVLYRYENHVAPAYRHFIEPSKEIADIIIPNNHSFDKALDMVCLYIRHQLSRKFR